MIGLVVVRIRRSDSAAIVLPNSTGSGRADQTSAPATRTTRALSSQPCEWCAGSGCAPLSGGELVACEKCGGIGEVPFDDSEAP